jgi:hypothetical protein
MQQIRIGTLNRVRDVIRKKNEGIKFDVVEDKKTEEDKKKQKFDKKYNDTNLPKLLESLLKTEKIKNDEYAYIEKCLSMTDKSKQVENQYERLMKEYIQLEPIYVLFLSKVRGIGDVLSANLIKEFGYCERYENVSKLWAHTGNSVLNGKSPKKRKGEDINFSPRLRTMTWKISDCLMKQNAGIYRQIYESEKNKQSERVFEKGELLEMFGKPYKEDSTKLLLLHSHNRALRKMRKMFLSHYWACSRELSGLSCRPLYVDEKLHHQNIITWKQALDMENNFKSTTTTKKKKNAK